jgi:hypothetical protein
VGRGQWTGSERHSRGNTQENTRRLGRCLSTAGANYNARIKPTICFALASECVMYSASCLIRWSAENACAINCPMTGG